MVDFILGIKEEWKNIIKEEERILDQRREWAGDVGEVGGELIKRVIACKPISWGLKQNNN